jgi:hypothetical protein
MLANGAIADETRTCRLVQPIAIYEKPFAYGRLPGLGRCRYVRVLSSRPSSRSRYR